MRKFVNEKRIAKALRLDPQPTRKTGNVLRILRVVLIVTLLPQLAAARNAPAPAASPAKSIGMFAYPKNKQSADQQRKDESESYASARQNSGVDPQAPAAASAEEQPASQKEAAQQAGKDVPKGGAVKGSAKGAAGGAAIGAIAGDAGTGAAIGATAGAMPGGVRKRKLRRKPQNRQLNRQPKLSNRLKPRATAQHQAWTRSKGHSRHAWMPVDIRCSDHLREVRA
jgi:hypothetical protein